MAMDHYERLGVERDAAREEIRIAYRALARELHPDRSGVTRDMAAVNEAWRVLGDERRRAEYDASTQPSAPRGAEATEATAPGRASQWAQRRPPTEPSLGSIAIEDPNELRLHRLMVASAVLAGVVLTVLLFIALTTSPSGS